MTLTACAQSSKFVSVSKPLPPLPSSVRAEAARGLTPQPKGKADADTVLTDLRRSEARKARALRNAVRHYDAVSKQYKGAE